MFKRVAGMDAPGAAMAMAWPWGGIPGQAAVVPPQVHAYAGEVPQLAAGNPGKAGVLHLAYEKQNGLTRVASKYHQAPMQCSRPLYVDPERPDMVFTYIITLGAGLLQGDRLTVDIDVGADAAVHLTTQSATKVLRMEHDYAVQCMRFTLHDGAYLEWVPHPLIPYRNSRLYQDVHIDLHANATLVYADMLLPGREEEQFAFDVFYNRVHIVREGTPVVLDTMCLEPAVRPLCGPAGLAEHRVLGTLYVLTPHVSPEVLADTTLHALRNKGDDVLVGVTSLPDDCGVMVRCVGSSPRLVRQTLLALWNAIRLSIVGCPAPRRITM